MKLHKLISRAVVGTALLGATFGGMLSINTHVNADGTSNPDSSLNSLVGSSAGTSSKATVNLGNGYLSLDNVPGLNFGSSNDTSSSNNLKLSTNGLLRVTDYRNQSKNDKDNNNNTWELDVQMDSFKDSNNNTTGKNWQMKLDNSKALSSTNGKNDQDNGIPVTSSSIFNDDNSPAQVMGTNNGTTNDGYGINSVNYNNDDAILNVPSVKPGTYVSNLTWTLSANMKSSNNANSSTNDAYNNANNTTPTDNSNNPTTNH